MIAERTIEDEIWGNLDIPKHKLAGARRRLDLEKEKSIANFARNKGRKTDGGRLPSKFRYFSRSGGRVKMVINSHSKFGLVDMVDDTKSVEWGKGFVEFSSDGTWINLGNVDPANYNLEHDETDFWVHNFLQNPRNRDFILTPWRTRRDVQGGSRKYKTHISKKRRGESSEPIWIERMIPNSWGGHSREGHWEYKLHTSGPKKRKTRFREKSKRKVIGLPPPEYITLPSEERRIDHIGDLARACQYVNDRLAPPDYFHHAVPQIDEALQTILGYVKSRADRALPIDINEVAHGKNNVINKRLKKWQHKYGKSIISLHHLLDGRFYTIKDDKEDEQELFERDIYGNETGRKRAAFIPIGTEVVISDGYHSEPERYVTNRKEMVSAARRILKGEIENMDYFRILDPVTHIALRWCVEQVGNYRTLINGEGSNQDISRHIPFKAEDVADLKNPELIDILKDEKLLDNSGKPLVYRFHMSMLPKTQIEDAQKRADRLAIADASREEKEELYSRIQRSKNMMHKG